MPQPRVAILGAGPIGIEAALYARSLGFPTTVYERNTIAANVQDWGFVSLFSPWRLNVTPLGLRCLEQSGRALPDMDVCPTGHEFRERYLMALAHSPLLRDCLREQCPVIRVEYEWPIESEPIGSPANNPLRLLVRHASGREDVDPADVVLDCTGTYGNHRWAGRGGIPAPGEREFADRFFYILPDILGKDRNRFVDRHTLVLGCGYSAATALFNLEKLARDHLRTKVSWAIRRPGQAIQAVTDDPLPSRRQLVQASMRLTQQQPTWLQFLGNCVMERIEDSGRQFGVTLNADGVYLALVVDEVVAMVGYLPDTGIYEPLSSQAISSEYQPTASGPQTIGSHYYILGAKTYGANSNFMLQIGHRQIREVFQYLSADTTVNLY